MKLRSPADPSLLKSARWLSSQAFVPRPLRRDRRALHRNHGCKAREGVDFFPLSVDFEEKLYSVGKIPGSFQRREGRASEKATLASRVIDRPIRPLFPKDMRNDVSVVATVMSVDPDCQPEIAAMLGVSIALSISEIPWDGPISGVSVGLIDGEYVINPTEAQREVSRMAVTVASTSDLVAMIEAGAKEVTNDEMFDGIMFAHKENQRIVEFIKGIQQKSARRRSTSPQTIPRLRCTRLSRFRYRRYPRRS